MGGLAEYVMSGRRQAIIAVLLLGLIPLANLLNPVVVGLVILRKGPAEGLLLFAWAMLPLLGWAMVGDLIPLIMLPGITGLGMLLRLTGSWEYILLAAIAVGWSVELYFVLRPEVLELLLAQVEDYLQVGAQQTVVVDRIRAELTGYVGAVNMFLAINLLMLSRWLQARLFNPGGFQKEFHSLKLGQGVALLLVGLLLLSSFEVIIPSGWLLYWLVPLFFAGIALVHAVVARFELSSTWLVIFYLSLLLPFVAQLLMLAALVDSWFDFRSRMRNPA